MDEYRIGLAGGFSYMPGRETPEQGRVRCALAIARSLHAYRADSRVYVTWEDSMFPWDGDFPMAENTVLLDAVLWAQDEDEGAKPVASLSSINVYSEYDDYCRVIEAELYDEARSEGRIPSLFGADEDAERDEMAARDIETVRR
jgi:hypothetical protein